MVFEGKTPTGCLEAPSDNLQTVSRRSLGESRIQTQKRPSGLRWRRGRDSAFEPAGWRIVIQTDILCVQIGRAVAMTILEVTQDDIENCNAERQGYQHSREQEDRPMGLQRKTRSTRRFVVSTCGKRSQQGGSSTKAGLCIRGVQQGRRSRPRRQANRRQAEDEFDSRMDGVCTRRGVAALHRPN